MDKNRIIITSAIVLMVGLIAIVFLYDGGITGMALSAVKTESASTSTVVEPLKIKIWGK